MFWELRSHYQWTEETFFGLKSWVDGSSGPNVRQQVWALLFLLPSANRSRFQEKICIFISIRYAKLHNEVGKETDFWQTAKGFRGTEGTCSNAKLLAPQIFTCFFIFFFNLICFYCNLLTWNVLLYLEEASNAAIKTDRDVCLTAAWWQFIA